MRLSSKQIQRLKNACIWVFGSRVDDQRRGGDYDFYVETSKADPDEIVADKLKMLADLHASPEFEGEKSTWSYAQRCQGRICQSIK